MKSIGLYLGIVVLLVATAGKARAQFIDTACIGEEDAMYRTGPRAGSVFSWTVEGGVIDSISADGSRIWVKWGNTGGVKRITVKETTKDGCPATPVDALVLLWPIGTVDIFGPEQVCKGTDAVLQAVGSADRYLWNTGDTTTFLKVNPDHDTTFSVIGYFGICSSQTSLHDLQVKYRPEADFNFSPTQPVIYDDVKFEYTGTQNVDKWSWVFYGEKNTQPGYSTLENPQYSWVEPGVKAVRLTVRNQYGCMDSLTKYIVIESGINVFIPDGFTPNGDGFNNIFIPVYENILTTEFSVMNRWGEIMFKTHSLNEGWDGSYKGVPVPDGVFVYLVKVKGKDRKDYVFRGTITVTR